jgi:hypothetical protein
VLLLEEGRYTFALDNGAVLRVWISPFTRSMAREEVNMGGVSVPRWERAWFFDSQRGSYRDNSRPAKGDIGHDCR